MTTRHPATEGTVDTTSLVIGGVEIRPGERATIRLPVARRYTQADVSLPVQVIRGRESGPRLFVSAAIHGDEINGVEIIRRLLRRRGLSRLRGALIAVPVVNVYGFLTQQRLLPDRRDLNRSFPGSSSGSLTARLANLFMEEVVANATHGIDLHTGAVHRTNLPHVRGCLDDPETARLAEAFGVPVLVNADLRDGSLRQAVLERKIPMLLYEAGEALRFDDLAIRAGLRGVLAVMHALGMLPGRAASRRIEPYVARSTSWARAPESGILRARVRLGAPVKEGDRLGVISDPLGGEDVEVHAHRAGVVIGRTQIPLVNEGDALFHVAVFEKPKSVAEQLSAFEDALTPAPADEPRPT